MFYIIRYIYIRRNGQSWIFCSQSMSYGDYIYILLFQYTVEKNNNTVTCFIYFIIISGYTRAHTHTKSCYDILDRSMFITAIDKYEIVDDNFHVM